MRFPIAALSAASLMLATPAFASYGSPPPPPPSSPGGSSSSASQEGELQTPRQQAEGYFRDAYDDVVKGSKDLADGKTDNAKKKFRRALERSRRAVETDSTYSEAWNLVGFTSRKLGDYPHSFEAYQVALRQKPEFALAREYFGEGLLETGDLAGARVQLGWLRRIGDKDRLAELEGAIARYVSAHPDSTGAPATRDTTAAGGR